MQLGVWKKAALAAGLWVVFDPQAAMTNDWESAKRLAQAAYFSDACRQQSEALGIARATDADALFAAFAQHFAHRATAAAASDPEQLAGTPRDDDCMLPPVLLINLMRSNGLDAALAFVPISPADATGDKDRVLVYVPALDRYFDPERSVGEQAEIGRINRDRRLRTHLYGPSLPAGDICADLCMRVISSGPDTVRVKTETLRGR